MRVKKQRDLTQRTRQTKSLKWRREILDLKNVLDIRFRCDAGSAKFIIQIEFDEGRVVAHIEINSYVKTQQWLGVMSSTGEHIHREKLDMHAGQFFLGMKFTQNSVHEFGKGEQRHFQNIKRGTDIDSRDQVRPDGSKI